MQTSASVFGEIILSSEVIYLPLFIIQPKSNLLHLVDAQIVICWIEFNVISSQLFFPQFFYFCFGFNISLFYTHIFVSISEPLKMPLSSFQI